MRFGAWTWPMIGDLIADKFGVRHHKHHVPRLLHQLGFSVQRPRKRLARANHEAQAHWLRTRFPEIQKKAPACRGVVMIGDEASFWLDGSLHRTWSRVGVQPRVDTFGARKTAHVFGIVTLEPRPLFLWRLAPVFNAQTFLGFLKELVRRCRRRKLFLIIDNGPCHNPDADGQAWLRANASRIQRLACRLARPSSTRSRASETRRRSAPRTTASSTRRPSAMPCSSLRSVRSSPTPR